MECCGKLILNSWLICYSVSLFLSAFQMNVIQTIYCFTYLLHIARLLYVLPLKMFFRVPQKMARAKFGKKKVRNIPNSKRNVKLFLWHAVGGHCMHECQQRNYFLVIPLPQSSRSSTLIEDESVF